MHEGIRTLLSVLAIAISIASLILSVRNVRLVRRFEAAKKRTELLGKILHVETALRAKLNQLLQLKELCATCLPEKAEDTCNAYIALVENMRTLYQEVDAMQMVTDPVKIESAMPKADYAVRKAEEIGVEIDALVARCTACNSRRENQRTSS